MRRYRQSEPGPILATSTTSWLLDLLYWGLASSALLWLIDSVADSLQAPRERFVEVLLHPTAGQLFVRLLLAVLAFIVVAVLQRQARAETKLRLFRKAVEDAPDGVQITDLQGRIVYSNRSVEQIYGYSPDELLGHHVDEMNADPGFARAEILPSLQERGRWAGELDVRHKEGRTFPIALSTSAVTGPGGEPAALVGIIRDISERRRAVEDLRERQQIANLLADGGLALGRDEPLPELLQHCTEAVVRHLDAALARIWTLDPDGAALTLRASAGLSSRLDGHRGRVLLTEKTKIASIARDLRPNLTNEVVGDPLVPDQEWAAREKLVSFGGYPILAEGRLVGVIAMFARRPQTDATMQAMESLATTLALGIVRHRAEAALRESEERFRRVFEEGPLGMAIKNPDGRLVQVNGALAEMTGYSSAELVGRRLSELADADGRAAHEAALARLLETEIPSLTMEERWSRKDGQAVWVRLTASALRGPAGRPRLGLAMVEDVSEQKRFEIALRQAKDRAEAAEGIKSEFLHIASHELRTPLNALALHVETLRHRLARQRPVGPELADRLMHQVRRLSYLVGDLLDSSRLDRGEFAIRSSTLDLTGLVRSTVDDFRGQATDREVSLTLPDAPITIDADPTRIEQVLANLLDNAFKYSPAGTSVEVRLVAGPSQVTLAVTDHGPGIPEEEKARLFTRFYRAGTAAARYQPGLGLGLYICRVIAESHGGSLRLESGPLTTFVLTLPLALPEAPVAS